MQRSINPDEGISGGLLGSRRSCSQRQIQSPADPATFESYVELMRQGSAGAARVAAAARILQREAHKTSLTAKAAMGALYKAGEDPFRYIDMQLNNKFKPAESEGEHVQESIRKQKEFNGEYWRDQTSLSEQVEKKVLAKKKKAWKLASKLKAAKEKAKNAAKRAAEMAKRNQKKLAAAALATTVIGSASAINQKIKQSKQSSMMLPDLGLDADCASLSAALMLTNTRKQLARRAAAAFVSAKGREPSTCRSSRDLDSLRDFL